MKKSLFLFTIFTGALFMSGNASAQTSEYANPQRWLATGGDNSRRADIFIAVPTMGFDASDDCYVNFNRARQEAQGYQNQVQGLFNQSTNIYHAVYRYARIGGCGNMNAIPTSDIIEAFDYYWKNYNKGERPFILFGFSQGAYVLWNLLLQYIDKDPNIQKYHIVTYAFGPPGRGATPSGMTAAQATALRNSYFSQSFNDLNKIVSFAAYHANDDVSGQGAAFATSRGGSPTNNPHTNPISWTTDATYRACTGNLCANNVSGAQVDYTKGVLIVNTTKAPQGSWGFHGDETGFFAGSIRQNIVDRIDAWYATYGGATVCENPAPTPTQGNLVRDGIFPGASLGSNWSLTNTGDNVVATASVRCNDANISITSVGAQIFQPQLIQSGIRLERGRAYRLTFRASAAANRTIVAQLERMGGNGVEWGHTYGRQTFNLTQAGATHTLEFNMTDPTDENAQLAFNFGGSGSTHNVTISDVVLVSTGTVSVNSIQPALAKQPLTTLRDRTLFVNASPETNVQVRIVNLSGKTVATINTHGGTTHSLSSIPAGTFIVEARRSGYNDVVTRRMTVQK